jgi:alcohol dehydrogenase-like protein
MKAFIYEKYGPPENLRMAELDKPVPNDDEVLVKVLAASVNAADWHIMRGQPLFSRATLGLLRPKHKILGLDVAGQVEAVGSEATRFRPGDEVYASLGDHGYGAFADYVAVPVPVMAPKPATLSFEEAAAVPTAAVTALQGLRRHGDLQPSQKVLINGASGGVGTFAVQIAKGLRGRGDRRYQHPQPRPGPLPRRRPYRGLHDHRLRRERAALRPHPGHGREPLGAGSQAGAGRRRQGRRHRLHQHAGGCSASCCAAARASPRCRRT